MLPASVVGGARMSGFCCWSGTFCGPKIEQPREPLTGWTSSVVVTLHAIALGSSLASGTVELGVTAVLVAVEERAGAANDEPARRIAQRTEGKSLFMLGMRELDPCADCLP